MSDTLHGRPIRGDISHYGSKTLAEPWPTEKFVEQLDALFEHPEVESIRWEQYTPYFNDGDACEFGFGELSVRFVGGDEEAGDNGDGFLSLYELGDWPEGYYQTHSRWDDSKPDYDPADFIPDFEADDSRGIVAAFVALDNSLKHYEVELRKLFGDPAQVTATRGGFDVVFYDHD